MNQYRLKKVLIVKVLCNFGHLKFKQQTLGHDILS